MTTRQEPLTINMSAIRVAGLGGLGMVATIVVVALAIPAARALLVAGIVTGAGLAWWWIRARRTHPLDGSDGRGPVGLVLTASDRVERHRAPTDERSNSRPLSAWLPGDVLATC